MHPQSNGGLAYLNDLGRPHTCVEAGRQVVGGWLTGSLPQDLHLANLGSLDVGLRVPATARE